VVWVAVIVLYLNVFVLIAQIFAKVTILQPLAPTQSEPPFLITEFVMLAIFVVLGILALVRFHPHATQVPCPEPSGGVLIYGPG
jgi:hypothetical protein